MKLTWHRNGGAATACVEMKYDDGNLFGHICAYATIPDFVPRDRQARTLWSMRGEMRQRMAYDLIQQIKVELNPV